MNIKKIHSFSALVITIFVSIHLLNHLYSILGAAQHIELMTNLRLIYRNVFVETILILSVFIQIISGIKLFIDKRKIALTHFDKIQLWSGLYLAVFFTFHLTAVFIGRHFLNLDTNFYFGVAGLNLFPFNLFFIPYYGLAILSFFGHIASIHYKKMKHSIFGLSPRKQSFVILTFGFILTIILFYGLTNRFHGIVIPTEYNLSKWNSF